MEYMLCGEKKKLLYTNIDVAKFVCALLVVCIHTRPLQPISLPADFYLADVVARVAVPLFFAMSGFLFFRQIIWENGKIKKCLKNRKRLWMYMKRLFRIYISWSAVYIALSIPQWHRSGWWGGTLIKDVLVNSTVQGTYYHLWYLLASLYAMPVLYMLLRFIPVRRMICLAGCLWLGECLLYSYSWVGIDRLEWLMILNERVPVFFDSIFRAIPLLTIGVVYGTGRIGLNKRENQCAVCVLIGLLMCVFEATVLHIIMEDTGRYSYLLTTPVFVWFMMQLLICGKQLQISSKQCAIFRESSLIIYCIHPLLIVMWRSLSVPDRTWSFCFTSISAIAISFVWASIKQSPKRGYSII